MEGEQRGKIIKGERMVTKGENVNEDDRNL
jgi:hypothetical protein